LYHAFNVRRGEDTVALLYSSELVCGVSSGVMRGATGQMSELVGGYKLAMGRCESGEEGCS
jgi:hypothetical protein